MGCCCGKGNSAVGPLSNIKFMSLNGTNSNKNLESSRFSKIGISTTNPLLLIKGYKNKPLLPLEEALKPFNGKIPQLDEQIKEAKSKCHYPSEHNLTHDESAAIYLYSMGGNENSIYNRLQKSWASNSRTQMKPWFKYLKLLKTGLNKLSNVEVEAWQGTFYDKNLEKTLTSNSLKLYTCMSPCSPSVQQVKNDIHGQANSKKILVGYRSVNGKDVTNYTVNNQKEIMIWPGIKLNRSKENEHDEHGSLIFHLTGKKNSRRKKVNQREKHFVCPTIYCHNYCRGGHALNHCYGFSHLSHQCSHHCGPISKCFLCRKHLPNLRECKQCHVVFCEECSTQ
ncbi:unnamed protein product [Adineta steineri]|uniref:Uncharacterized protein n=1 Tax=Adineta steineri TaxID=433720 RepID=A0A814X9D8_9BILA|nr:unnamed protein product [Adineta steineri]